MQPADWSISDSLLLLKTYVNEHLLFEEIFHWIALEFLETSSRLT